jgi:hypothetical protein
LYSFPFWYVAPKNLSTLLASFTKLPSGVSNGVANGVAHLSTEAAEEGVPEVAKCEREVLVEEVAEELAHPGIAKNAF